LDRSQLVHELEPNNVNSQFHCLLDFLGAPHQKKKAITTWELAHHFLITKAKYDKWFTGSALASFSPRLYGPTQFVMCGVTVDDFNIERISGVKVNKRVWNIRM
jgi:hypothetical protein